MDMLKSGLFALLILFSAALFANIMPDWQAPAPAPTADEVLVKNLQQQLRQTQYLSALNINVNCQDGLVVLGGVADTAEQVNTMVLLFMGTAGVKDVDVSSLLIGDKRIDNQDILVAKINGVLMREQILEKDYVIKPIEVYANQGKVVLLGIVEKQKQAKEIVDLVKTVNGVQDIESKIITIEAHRYQRSKK